MSGCNTKSPHGLAVGVSLIRAIVVLRRRNSHCSQQCLQLIYEDLTGETNCTGSIIFPILMFGEDLAISHKESVHKALLDIRRLLEEPVGNEFLVTLAELLDILGEALSIYTEALAGVAVAVGEIHSLKQLMDLPALVRIDISVLRNVCIIAMIIYGVVSLGKIPAKEGSEVFGGELYRFVLGCCIMLPDFHYRKLEGSSFGLCLRICYNGNVRFLIIDVLYLLLFPVALTSFCPDFMTGGHKEVGKLSFIAVHVPAVMFLIQGFQLLAPGTLPGLGIKTVELIFICYFSTLLPAPLCKELGLGIITTRHNSQWVIQEF